jgi:uncharacterized protein YdeI (YjbR/CyaY-like superfamily)
MPTPVDVAYFPSAAHFRRWLGKHHATARELWVGFYKKQSGKPSLTWPESVDEALCVGWIDGIRKRIDEERYTIRFTPRRAGSIWSTININRVKALAAGKRMKPAGLNAFEARTENRSGVYSYEQPRPAERPDRLGAPYAGILAKHRRAAAFFAAQPPSYRKLVCWWVTSAKQEETRIARVKKLIAACKEGRRL